MSSEIITESALLTSYLPKSVSVASAVRTYEYLSQSRPSLRATLALVLPESASANRFTEVSFELTDENAIINLESDEPVSVPRIGTPSGMVKAWFDNMNHSSLRVDGDGEVFRYLRVRPGAQGSGLLTSAHR